MSQKFKNLSCFKDLLTADPSRVPNITREDALVLPSKRGNHVHGRHDLGNVEK
jgi:hypothetical protein